MIYLSVVVRQDVLEDSSIIFSFIGDATRTSESFQKPKEIVKESAIKDGIRGRRGKEREYSDVITVARR